MLSALALATSRVSRSSFSFDLGDQRAELVAAGDQPPVDHAVVGLVGMAADDDVDRLVQLPNDLDDRAGDARALVHSPRSENRPRRSAPRSPGCPCPQLRHQRVDRFGFVMKGQASNAGWHDDVGRRLQRQADEGYRDSVELLDVVGRQDGLARRVVDGAGGEVLEPGAGEAARLAALRYRAGSRRFASAAVPRCPSSNSWLPTALASRPISESDSMVGSSCRMPESSGLAPIRSPAATKTELGWPGTQLLDQRRHRLRPSQPARRSSAAGCSGSGILMPPGGGSRFP